MSALQPVPFRVLLTRMVEELERQGSIFDLPTRKMWNPGPDRDTSARFLGRRASTPLGPAAGPHTQLAQNIVLAFLGGARIFELKTVQVLDELEIPRPCIDARTVGYNVEWSQELKVEQALQEYVAAWTLIHILIHDNPLELTLHRCDFVFDASVGYDLAGIRSDKVSSFLRGLRDASAHIDALRRAVPAHLAHLAEAEIPARVADSVTLSTFHGCPPGEIEGIVEHLIEAHDVDVIVKMNPTLLGPEVLESILHGDLGYTDVRVPPGAFEADLSWDEAVDLLTRLQRFGRARGRQVGVKFTNTLVVENNAGYLPASEEVAYLSGQPLHVLAMNLVARWREAFGASMPVSFSGGVDARNVVDAVACGLVPVTMCTDLLRPGGYGRLPRYLRKLEARMDVLRASNLDDFIIATHGTAAEGLKAALADWDALAAPHLPDAEARQALGERLSRELPDGLEAHLSSAHLLDLRAWLHGRLDATAEGLAALEEDLANDLHRAWARQCGALNTRVVAPKLRRDPRYAMSSNAKPPNTVPSRLELFDCLNCDKCVPACPNDANFVIEVDPTPRPIEQLRFEADGVHRRPDGTLATEGLHQLATYTDFCNLCGNCEVFCPEQGAPFEAKPRFFSDWGRWREDDGDGFLVRRGDELDQMWGRIDGRAYSLVVWRNAKEPHAVFADHAVALTFTWPGLELVDWRWLPDAEPCGPHELSTRPIVTMKLLMDAVLDRNRPNYVNAAQAPGVPP